MADNLARDPAAIPPTTGDWPALLRPDGERLALVTWSAGSRVTKGGEAHKILLTDAAADLDALNSGRGRLLAEHHQYLDGLIGVIEVAWLVPEVAGHAVVRFGKHEGAEHLRRMLLDGMPLSASLGYQVLEAEPAPGHTPGAPSFICTKWRATEISIVLSPADPGAFVHRPAVDVDLATLAAEQRSARAFRQQVARLERLRPADWLAWASGAGAEGLAAKLDLPREPVADILAELVADHLRQLGADAAGDAGHVGS